MKIWIASASALLLTCACSASKDATAALTAMHLDTGKSSPVIQYQGKSGSGDTITLNDVTLGGGTGDGMKAKSMVLGGLDMTAAGKPVLTSITLKGLSPEKGLPEGMTFVIDSVGVEGLNPATGEFVASSFTDTGASNPPAFKDWGFAKISINGLKFNGDFSSMGVKGGKFNVGLQELSVSNLKDTVFASAKMTGFKGDFDVPAEAAGGNPIAGKFDFGTADIKNIRGGVFADAMGAAMSAAMTDPTKVSTLEADIMKGMTSPLEGGFDEFTWTGLNAEASGAKLVVSPVKETITRDAKGIATGLNSPRTTITFTSDPSGGAVGQAVTMMLGMVGYPSNTIEFYGQASATFDPATDTTKYTDYNFGLTDGFDVKATASFQGLTKFISALMASMTSFESTLKADDPFAPKTDDGAKPATPAPEPDVAGFEALKVVDLDVTVTDKTLVNLLLGLGGMTGMGGDVETLRTDVINMLQGMGADLTSAGVDQTVANELTAALAAFVKQPGSLNIKLKPPTPISFADQTSKATKQSLGFSATFTPSGAAPKPAAPAKPAKPN